MHHVTNFKVVGKTAPDPVNIFRWNNLRLGLCRDDSLDADT